MSSASHPHKIVLDIGKTHVKLHVLDEQLKPAFAKQMTNAPDASGIYPCANVDKIWLWLCETIKEVTKEYDIRALTVTTHGATAALIDRNEQTGNGLVLPVLDYEFEKIFEQASEYESVRETFSKTCSPSLPAGLNLGRQIFWLKQEFPEAFKNATDILMYPQYWIWRLTGQRYSEITSLGCHTDLWSIADNDYSSFVDAMDLRGHFPELKPAWFNCGLVKSDIADELGLSKECAVFNGLHDSNASFLRYRLTQDDKPFTVISTGTWTILMASQAPLSGLDPAKDMLANIDALGSPVACARFMGGREFESICDISGSWLGEQFDLAGVQEVVQKGAMALPDFSEGSGPFGGRSSGFAGPVDQVSGIALATVYCALMIDYQLSMLNSTGDIFIEGAFLKNPILCGLVKQLRADQNVLLSQDSTGTVLGAAYLTDWDNIETAIETKDAIDISVIGLTDYRDRWVAMVQA